MANFALIDENNFVVTVIVAERDFIESGALGDPSKWIEDTDEVWNVAAVGFKWDKVNNAFIPPQPYASHTLNDKFEWTPPIPHPNDGKVWRWNEDIINWEEVL
jgi:hypothetical protein